MLSWAFGLYALGQLGDILSTMVGMTIKGIVEANPLMADPETQKFLLMNGLFIKALHTVIEIFIPSFFLYKATKNGFIATLPFFYHSFPLYQVTLHNVLVIWRNY